MLWDSGIGPVAAERRQLTPTKGTARWLQPGESTPRLPPGEAGHLTPNKNADTGQQKRNRSAETHCGNHARNT
jgi:hypothetical protein